MTPLPTEAQEYLGSLQSERGLSLNTVAAYRRDLLDYFTQENREPWRDSLRTSGAEAWHARPGRGSLRRFAGITGSW